jgi:hypothetical protein
VSSIAPIINGHSGPNKVSFPDPLAVPYGHILQVGAEQIIFLGRHPDREPRLCSLN